MSERTFTPDDAEAELEELRRRLPGIAVARQRLIDASRAISDAVQADGGGVEGTDWFRAQRELREGLEWLASRGILLRDPETGLVDFPAQRDGRRVFLCWKLGEDRVAWYHEEDTGFAGRRPL